MTKSAKHSVSLSKVVCTFTVFALVSVFSAGSAFGQLESNVLGDNWPTLFVPPYVMELPQPNTTELQPPRLEDRLAAGKVAPQSDAASDLLGIESKDGDPEATRLEDMMKAPREAITLARAGKYEEAIAKGEPLLSQDRATYGDYTWDLLTSAVAWSQMQTGAWSDSIASRRLGGSRIRDKDVKQYHMIVARTLERLQKDSPDKLEQYKDHAQFQMEVIKELQEPVRQILRSIELAKNINILNGRVRNLKVAYDNLRLVMAVDRDTGNKILNDYFRPAADSLITETAQTVLEAGQKQYQVLVRAEEKPMARSQIAAWNSEVGKLWNLVREAKRLARLHNYLQRLELAGNADNGALFNSAHELLFAPGELRHVWQTTGRSTAHGFDMRRRAPSTETPSRTEQREAAEREREW